MLIGSGSVCGAPPQACARAHRISARAAPAHTHHRSASRFVVPVPVHIPHTLSVADPRQPSYASGRSVRQEGTPVSAFCHSSAPLGPPVVGPRRLLRTKRPGRSDPRRASPGSGCEQLLLSERRRRPSDAARGMGGCLPRLRTAHRQRRGSTSNTPSVWLRRTPMHSETPDLWRMSWDGTTLPCSTSNATSPLRRRAVRMPRAFAPPSNSSGQPIPRGESLQRPRRPKALVPSFTSRPTTTS